MPIFHRKIYQDNKMTIKDILVSLGLIKNNKFYIPHRCEYYAKMFFDQILPQIEQITNQSRYGYHGLTHTTQVALFGLDIAYTINQDPLPVLLAAGLHDCARTNDEWCTQHGPQAVPVARDFLSKNYPNLSRNDLNKILRAIKNHTCGTRARDGVSACLWDGDRIRLSWEYGYKPEFFSTIRGRQIAGLGYAGQLQYITDQENMLIKNNIRTREQIEYDRRHDEIQNNIGKQFKLHTR